MNLEWIGSRFFKRTVARVISTVSAYAPGNDPWEGSCGAYIEGFRDDLDDIAAILSEDGPQVATRYEPDKPGMKRGWVTFRTSTGDVLATVRVYGECGCPCGMNVVLSDDLSKAGRGILFLRIWHGRVHLTDMEHFMNWL